MTLELVASLAPAPLINTRLEFQHGGRHPFFSLAWSLVTAVPRKGKIMAKKVNSKSGNIGRKQTFTITAPGALKMQLMGDFTHWQEHPIHLEKAADGVWRTTLELAPGRHHYRFFVDGGWRDDPECTLRAPNPYGGENMIRQVSASGTE